MSSIRDEFTDLMARVKAGCPEAARALVERFGGALRVVVRRHLSRQLRPLFDSTDFTQTVWLEFFSRALRDNVFTHPERLAAFLVDLAQKRLIDAHRQHLDTQKHDRARAVPLDEADDSPVAREPDPAAAAAARVDVERLLARLPEPLRRLALLLRAGCSEPEMAEELGVSGRTVRRMLELVRARARSPAAPPTGPADREVRHLRA
jgi:RNA polymerase sigma factor (sigma-70 family)